MHKTISKYNYETSIVSASFSCCAFLFKKFADKFIAITRLLIFNVIDINLICLSVIKWSTDMTTFTRIDGYGVHPPLSDYLVVRKVKLYYKIPISLNGTFHPEKYSISFD